MNYSNPGGPFGSVYDRCDTNARLLTIASENATVLRDDHLDIRGLIAVMVLALVLDAVTLLFTGCVVARSLYWAACNKQAQPAP